MRGKSKISWLEVKCPKCSIITMFEVKQRIEEGSHKLTMYRCPECNNRVEIVFSLQWFDTDR